jgi:starch synthase (maltosyl-transferring)
VEALGLEPEDLNEDGSFWVDDLVSGESWRWGARNYVRLDPRVEPAHVLHVRRSR